MQGLHSIRSVFFIFTQLSPASASQVRPERHFNFFCLNWTPGGPVPPRREESCSLGVRKAPLAQVELAEWPARLSSQAPCERWLPEALAFLTGFRFFIPILRPFNISNPCLESLATRSSGHGQREVHLGSCKSRPEPPPTELSYRARPELGKDTPRLRSHCPISIYSFFQLPAYHGHRAHSGRVLAARSSKRMQSNIESSWS